MSTVITALTSTTIGKWIYGIVFSFSTVSLLQESTITNSSFFEALLSNVPAQVIYVLGIIYGVAIVLSKLSDFWKRHKINMLSIKQEQEHLEQEEIETEKQRKDLD